jgi:hypothetical protein
LFAIATVNLDFTSAEFGTLWFDIFLGDELLVSLPFGVRAPLLGRHRPTNLTLSTPKIGDRYPGRLLSHPPTLAAISGAIAPLFPTGDAIR